MWRNAVSVAAMVAASTAQAEVAFAPVAVPEHVYDGGWEYFVGGGVAAFDCSGDGLPELVAAGGENPITLLRNVSTPERLAFDAATPEALAVTAATGVYPVDIDGDGWRDLVVLRVGENLVFKGGAACSFAPMTLAGFDGGTAWTTAFSATWEQPDALPTLAFGNYVDRDNPEGPFEACDDNVLLRAEGGRYAPTVLAPGFCPLSILFSDWGRQGRADLRMSNDRHYYVRGGAEQLWAMEATPRLLGEADGWATHMLWGMGIAERDLDFDGVSEVFLSSMGDQRMMKRVDAAKPTYEDVPYELGTSAHRPYVGDDGRPSTGWHIAFGDVTNDGLDDVFIAKGNVQQMPGAAMEDPNNLLIQQPDGRFEEFGDVAGVASMARSRGAALVDLNGDGLLDLAVLNRRAPLEVYQNISSDAGDWLSVRLKDTGRNVDAVGAVIEVKSGARTYVREVTVGGGHAGGVAVPEHFGLGALGTEARSRVAVRVLWPDGTQGGWFDAEANQTVTLGRNGVISR